MLRCISLSRIASLFRVASLDIALRVASCCITLRRIALRRLRLHCIALLYRFALRSRCYIKFQRVVSLHIALHRFILHCTALHHVVSLCIAFALLHHVAFLCIALHRVVSFNALRCIIVVFHIASCRIASL
jgi:hypothetical protein